MIKKTALLIFLFSTAFAGKGQNLVPNGDFEQYIGCPSTLSQIDSVSIWFNPSPWLGGGASPDYFNQCATNYAGVPDNLMGYQPAHSGGAYAGLILYFWNGWREYIEAPLTSTLVANSCYHFEMYACLGEVGKFTSDDIGIYFSDTAVTGITNFLALPYIPQLNNMTGNLFDTLNWKSVSLNYTATGGENYLIIGNFKDNSNTDTILINNNAPWAYAYVYVDDVSLTPCTALEEQNEQGSIKIYPNPVKDYLKINYPLAGKEKTEIKITDILGKEIYSNQFSNSKFQIPTSNFKNGIYFIAINDGKNIYRKKFLKE